MLVDIEKVRAVDRIRKDFGDIAELAEDIKTNGLINPPVVIPEADGTFTLLAGERRLKAMQMLGYRQIEIRTWANITEAERLEVEISENNKRKPFNDREQYAAFLRRLKYRQSKSDTSCLSGTEYKSPTDLAARDVHLGHEKMRQISAIIENEQLLDPSDIAEWDAKKLSTNKLFQKLQAELAAAKAASERAEGKAQELQRKLAEAESRPPEVVKVEVEPPDYTATKKKLSSLSNSLSATEADNRRLIRELDAVREKAIKLEEQANAAEEGTAKRLADDALFFCGKVDNFLSNVGGYAYLTDRLSELPSDKKKMYVSAVTAITAWGQNIIEGIGE